MNVTQWGGVTSEGEGTQDTRIGNAGRASLRSYELTKSRFERKGDQAFFTFHGQVQEGQTLRSLAMMISWSMSLISKTEPLAEPVELDTLQIVPMGTELTNVTVKRFIHN